jgi:hypothetical protein
MRRKAALEGHSSAGAPQAKAGNVGGSDDVFSSYEAGLRQLLERLGRRDPRYSQALVYQQRLKENIAQSRRYGDTDTRKAERSEIIDQLNGLALSAGGVPFSELCGIPQDSHSKPSQGTESLDARILQFIYGYFQEHPGDPKVSLNEMVETLGEKRADIIQCLLGLKEKGWLDYDLTEKAEVGLVWLTRLGTRVARDTH